MSKRYVAADKSLAEFTNEEETRDGGTSIEIELSGTQGLVRRLSDRRLPRSQLENMASLDLAASTPLDADQVKLFFESELRSSRGTHYLVLKQHRFAELSQQIHNAGLRARTARFLIDGKSFRIDARNLRELGLASAWQLHLKRSLTIGLAALAVTLFATIGHGYWKIAQAGASVEEKLNLAQKKVRILAAENRLRRQRLEQVQAVRAARSQQIPITTIWEELTRLTPDSAWITDLSVTTNEVIFSGFARSAAGLVPALDTSRWFKNPAISGRVLRSNQTTSERFTIRLEPEV